MTPQRYKEIKVIYSPAGKVEKEYETDRGHVSIHEHEAEFLNEPHRVRRTGLKYELAEPMKGVNKVIIPDRIDLEIEADELGLKVHPKISDTNLYKKIQEFKTKKDD